MRLILLASCLLLAKISFAQNLGNTFLGSDYKLVYQLSIDEASEVSLAGNVAIKDFDLFSRVPVDTLWRGSSEPYDPDYGFYMLVGASAQKMEAELLVVQNIEMEQIPNGEWLEFILLHEGENRIKGAGVWWKNKRLTFDESRDSYRIKPRGKKGIIKVKYDGVEAIFPIGSEHNGGSLLKKVGRKIIYSFPIKIIWTPFRDIYKSIQYNYPIGFVHSVFSIFDPDLRDYRDKTKAYGYLVMNKPKFKPNDTLKYKIKLAKPSGKPFNKSIRLKLDDYSKTYYSKELVLENGQAHGEIVLTDSLNMNLDASYNLRVEFKDYSQTSTHFLLEDYVLKSETYTLELKHESHSRGNENVVVLSGKDENEKRLQSNRYRVMVDVSSLDRSSDERLKFVPNRIFETSGGLDTRKDTEVILPDSIFPTTNINYEVKVEFLNGANDRIEKSADARFYHSKPQISMSLKNDSIYFSFPENYNGPQQLKVVGEAEQYQMVISERLESPLVLKLNPSYQYYKVYDLEGQFLEQFNIREEDSGMGAYRYRSFDSLKIEIQNERLLPLWYSLFKGKKLVQKGFSEEAISIERKARSKELYTLQYKYLWGNKISTNELSIPYYDKLLNIDVEQQSLIIPGVSDSIKIKVTDHKGRPVPNVDITALSQTSKFNRTNVPDIPYFGKQRSISFSHTGFYPPYHYDYDTHLYFEDWKEALGLDSLLYYQVTRTDELFAKSIPSADSITQFSAFSIKYNGLQDVAYLKLDDQLVFKHYGGWSVPYSFQADPGYHKVSIRTKDELIIVDSVYFKPYHKTVISIPNKLEHPLIKRIDSEDYAELSDDEKIELGAHTLFLKSGAEDNYYVRQGMQKHYMKPERGTQSLGPFLQDTVSVIYSDSTVFKFKFESGYVYEIINDEIFRRATYNENLKFPLPVRFRFASINGLRIFDFLEREKPRKVLTLNNQLSRVRAPLIHRSRFSSKPDKGLLAVNIPEEEIAKIERVFLLPRKGRTEPQEVRYDLITELDSGSHSMVFISDSLFTREDFHIEAEGVTILTPSSSKRYPLDSLIVPVLVEEPTDTTKRIYRPQVITIPPPRVAAAGLVTGQVFDEAGFPLPLVTVLIKGTTIGVPTNANGFYSIELPPGNHTLIFRFLGYTQQEVTVGYQPVINVIMQPEVSELAEEVIVTGLGISHSGRSRGFQSKPVPVDRASRILRGKVPGVDISYASGTAGSGTSVIIRGNTSISGENKPLYVVDGVPVTDLSAVSPDAIMDISVLKGASATTIYGEAGRNGVVLITTSKNSLGQVEENNFEIDFSDAENSIRSNFSDYAFWNPSITTNELGEAAFKVTYPDDVTSWSTHFLAMDNKGYTGQLTTTTKAFKPMVSRLSMPRLLVEGDETIILGQISNYTGDTTLVSRRFEVDGVATELAAMRISDGHLDSLQIKAVKADTIKASYLFKSEKLSDGELREIPVYGKGLQKTEGQLFVLENDTAFTIQPNIALGPTTLTVMSDLRSLLLEDIRGIHAYGYWCNEQKASKLIALIAEKELLEKSGQKFTKSGKVRSLIRRLNRGQNKDGTWGWWEGMRGASWVTNHVTKSLSLAEKHGYVNKADFKKTMQTLVRKLPYQGDRALIETMYTLTTIEPNIVLKYYLTLAEKQKHLSVTDQIRLMYVQHRQGLEVNLEGLDSLKRESSYGGIYFKEYREQHQSGSVLATLAAYNLLKAVGGREDELSQIRKYLMLNRPTNTYLNTYLSSEIINTIGGDLKALATENEISVNGTQIENFPFQKTYASDNGLDIEKRSGELAYLMSSQEVWVDDPKPDSQLGTIKTWFAHDEKNIPDSLMKGTTVMLKVTLEISEDAEFAMLEIPIPAGSTYADKPQSYRFGTHREYFRDRVNFYFEKLRAGKHKYEIPLNIQFPGNYTLNPAKFSLMYRPLLGSNNTLRSVVIN